MSIDKIKQKLIQTSIKDSGWQEKAKWRKENEDWLDISFSIAVKIASTLSANKKTNVSPKSQVELAEAMGCSAQYINKLLRGEEKLQIDTICRLQRILNITLIKVPQVEIQQYEANKIPTLLPSNISQTQSVIIELSVFVNDDFDEFSNNQNEDYKRSA